MVVSRRFSCPPEARCRFIDRLHVQEAYCYVVLLPKPGGATKVAPSHLTREIENYFAKKELTFKCTDLDLLYLPTTVIVELPRVLVVQLLRNETDVIEAVPRIVPLSLDLKPYVTAGLRGAPSFYRLVAVGHAITTQRHYVASVLRNPGQVGSHWIRCNDERVTALSWPVLPLTAGLPIDDAMLLFFEQQL